MTRWLKIIEHLLPNGRSWRLTSGKSIRSLFDGIGATIGDYTKSFFDEIFNDIDPQKTRALKSWEKQFALRSTGLTEQRRRDILEATWKAVGGQDPRYIQDTLQAAGFNVYVHEWWEPINGRVCGGSINGDVIPIARDPFDYLDDGTGALPNLMFDGGLDTQDGGSTSCDGARQVPAGYPLVNKLMILEDGIYVEKKYAMPDSETTYPYYLYIGGEVFPNQAYVKTNRKEEFENLCLKICPTEQWLGVLVTYV
jgi:uncharacterized protein YmfQ (DUF2313 family)